MGLAFLKIVGLASAIWVTSPSGLLAPEQLHISKPFVFAMMAAQVRANDSDKEEFYCLVGREVRGDLVITSIVRPMQSAAFYTKPDKDGVHHPYEWNLFLHSECPENTVGDFHTHPGDGALAWMPSDIDTRSWVKDKYGLHIISYNLSGGTAFIVFVRHGKAFVPFPADRVVMK